MKTLVILFPFLLFSSTLFAQGTCGTEPTEEQLEFMRENLTGSSFARSARVETVRIPLKFHIIRRSNGTGGLSESRISSLINEVNQAYATVGFEFYQAGDINNVLSDEFFNLDASQEGQLAGSRDQGGLINIYVSNSLSSGSSALCGYTYFPPSADRIFLAQGCVTNGPSTTIHELGHYFTLFHTHGKTNNGTTDELVNGSNCETAGDNVCDTPADPNLSGNVGSGCSYTGSAVDANGTPFSPDPSNIMSYAPSNCRSKLTAGQLSRAADGLAAGRSYLNLQYTNFTPRLTASSFEGCNPYTVTFTDVTSGSVVRRWIFEGADIESSTSKEVTVTYNEPGTYDVTLSVTNQAGAQREIVRENFISVANVYGDTIQSNRNYGFADGQIPERWNIYNEDLQESFGIFTYGNNEGAIAINHYNYESVQKPAIDDLELSGLSVNDAKQYSLRFDVSYKYQPGIFSDPEADSLFVGYKLNCNNSFRLLRKIGGKELAVDTSSVEYVIDEGSEWKNFELTVDFDDVFLTESDLVIVPVIRSVGYNNNNIYIDNVEIVPNFDIKRPNLFRSSEVNEQYIDLRWSNQSKNITQTLVQRSFDEVNWETIGNVGPTDNIFRDSIELGSVSQVFYRAFSKNNVTQSAFSDVERISSEVLSGTDIQENNMQVYPNPFMDALIVNNVPIGSTIVVSSVEGREILRTRNTSTAKMNLTELSQKKAGLYILSVIHPSFKGKKSFRIIKN